MEKTEVVDLLASYAEVIVVNAESVQGYTLRGYRLLHVIESGQALMERGGGSYDSSKGRNTEPDRFVVNQPLFVMGKARDKLVDELRASIEGLQTQAEVQRVNEGRLTKVNEQLDKDKKAFEHDIARLRQENEAARAAHKTMQDRARKMEEDIARVRNHIGAKLFDEAIKGLLP
jgi:hypothetical protein